MSLVLIVTRNEIQKRSNFSKRDDEKLTKMAVKISAVMAGRIATSNNEALESVLKEIERLNLKG